MSLRAKHATLRARLRGSPPAATTGDDEVKRILLAATCLFAALAACGSNATDLGYDPQADPFEQYHDAIEAARSENKLVLIIAGGDWCSWCHALDRFLKRDDGVRDSLNDAFVVMKVYVGDENYNRDFFGQLPEARGAPHFWIVSPERRVLASQSTGQFERQGRGYDRGELLAFIDRWKKHAAEGP